ncbi:MAG TPA: hypothetical protein VEC01_09260 [Noviherbaspirillum sp.]|uniref:hypothetical protein n=1 Tax=Noviherbaspirillum sp. TaxID=1926288 RepID=UPI002D4A2521|nr:hypothetical protein [Noviherbaspirillum sp.]HYD95502.1 hypothetical protein [Noviherbaspirillum sp.]
MLRIAAASMLALSLLAPSLHAASPEPTGKMLFVKPVALRGTLGAEQVQVNLRTKAEFEDGIEGDYFIFGSSHRVLLAGEIEGEEFFLEESVNGTDVSGQWEGKMAGDTISGEWQSVDGKLSKPFQLRVVRPAKSSRP